MSQCALCEVDSPRYAFSQVCCASRFLCVEPRREVRRAMLERMRLKHGAEFADAVEAAVRKRWAQRGRVERAA